jgi:hypothetical protein
MSARIRDWTIIAVCLHVIAGFWMAANPTTLGHWQAMRDVAYDSIWSEYVSDCDCTEPLDYH